MMGLKWHRRACRRDEKDSWRDEVLNKVRAAQKKAVEAVVVDKRGIAAGINPKRTLK
jgi:hypothetical protein